jgi:hypothetical protein
MSPVTEAKRGWSWFSLKEPRREVSLHEDLTSLIDEERAEMEPDVEEKAEKSGK